MAATQILLKIPTDLHLVLNIEFVLRLKDLPFTPDTHTRVIFSHPIGSEAMELSGAWEAAHTNGILIN